MRFVDLLIMALRGLWRQKMRSALTVVGVAVGACALAFSVSLGLGLRHMIDEQHHKKAAFWQVDLFVPEFEPIPESEIPAEQINLPDGIDGERRARVRERLIRQHQARHPRRPASALGEERLAELAAIPDVIDVVAGLQLMATIRRGDQRTNQLVLAYPMRQLALAPRIVAGALPDSDDAEAVVVSESYLYDLGVRTDAELAAAIGTPMEITVGPSLPFIPPARGEFRIAAVFRDMTAPEREAQPSPWSPIARGEVFVPLNSGRRLWRKASGNQGTGYRSCTVHLRPGGDLRAVTKEIESMGLRPVSMLATYESVKMEVTLIAAGLNLFAMISVAVAALGIANTLATSVVERTREIGILKAVGATRTQVLAIFLVEGTVIGLIGGALGLLAAWLVTFPADGFVARLIHQQSMGNLKVQTVFLFPVWLPPATLVFATLVTTIAALLPARRAARMEPIAALRSL